MSNFNDKLQTLLKTDPRFVDQEWELIRNEIINQAFKIDTKLIELLISDDEIKSKFFDEIKGHRVFNINKFVDFIQDKNFLDDSYTKYKNKIWLNIWGKFLRERDEVSLVRPYKDCILEWGQSKEDQKRKEIFFNEILAQDEIDRLLDPKVLTNFKKYTKDWEKKVESFTRDENGTISDNLIIKWNNLLALHSLKSNFAGKVKLIYIDPPYNTWNDSFNYNDKFNHSTWLTFMKNRLEVARELLRDDWAIFVQCDDNEQAYLKVLMDEIFWMEKLINVISVKMNESKGLKNAHIEKRMPKNKEYLLIYWKKQDNFLFNPEKIEKEIDEMLWYVKYYNKFIPNISDDISNWNIESYNSSEIKDKLKDKSKLIYMVKPDNEIKYDNLIINKFFKITNSKWKDNVFYYNWKDILKVLFLWENTSKFLWDLWLDISTININKESWVQTLSNWQKPEKLIQRVISLSTNPWDIVLDYHLWSGTTCAVAHKMWRQYIWIEQMDYIENIAVERMKKVIDWEQWGISKSVNWQWWWEFIYCELKKYNQDFMDQIQDAKKTEELLKIWENMKTKSFLNYNVDIAKQDEAIEGFKQLSLEQQKQALVELLDKNQLYVNLSEINDEDFEVSKEDKKLNDLFYNP